MRILCYAVVSLGLGACQTPSGVIDTAGAVSQMATKLDGAVSDYVAASNANRADDESRLALDEQQSVRRIAENADQFKILDLTVNKHTRSFIAALRTTVAVSSGPQQAIAVSAQARLASEFGQNTFDSAPLTRIATTAGALAKPLDLKEELVTFGTFSKQVYDELKSVKSAAGSGPSSP